MFWKIISIVGFLIAVLDYLIIRGASMTRTDEEKAEEDMQQLLFIREYKKRKERKKNEKTNNSRETECCKRISENLERMFKE